MHILDFYKLAIEVAQENDFELGECIYKGEYYSPDNIRDLIYEGVYKGFRGKQIKEPAILKVYSDPRTRDDGPAQINFVLYNKSKILRAPAIYKHDMISPTQGWSIMEKLPAGHFLKSPLEKEERGKFLELYVEYKNNSPQKPHRKLSLAENLPAHEYHCFRIARWLQLAHDKEAELVLKGEEPILNPKEFIPRFEEAMKAIREMFGISQQKKMYWCAHGHFKPDQIFKMDGQEAYFLTDFAHAKMFPQGYELAFVVWADWLMAADWRMEYSEWKKGIREWIDEMEKIAPKIGLTTGSPVEKAVSSLLSENPDTFHCIIRISLIERILGAILADIIATNRSREEKNARISLLYQLFDDLVKDLS